jgi:hypothetical protein
MHLPQALATMPQKSLIWRIGMDLLCGVIAPVLTVEGINRFQGAPWFSDRRALIIPVAIMVVFGGIGAELFRLLFRKHERNSAPGA